MAGFTMDEAIGFQRKMIEDDMRSARDAYLAGSYAEAAKDLAAVIGEMGALMAFEMVKDGTVAG